MPTSEANTATPKNTNAALSTEEVESSKANVCITMTQDPFLDNIHQAASNVHSTNDQVSDDLKSSKNNLVSNGVSNVQEFNVDVNSKRSEHSANVAFVQNSAVDADSPPAGKVSTTSEHSATISTDFTDLKEHSDSLVSNIDVKKSECGENSLLSDMTVITHQNSSENIRDIIASSDKIHKVSSDSQLTGIVNNVNSGKNSVNENSVNKSGAIKKKLISSKSKSNSQSENDQSEDPVERLNKLRASISNALSEVKGVLKQYSTEQSIDGENESTSSSQPADDGPVRFRFVRKIRRRSVFSEDDDGKVSQNNENAKEVKPETTRLENPIVVHDVSKDVDNNSTKVLNSEQTSSTVVEQKRIDDVPEIPKEELATSSKNKQNDQIEQIDENNEKSRYTALESPTPTQLNSQQKNVREVISNQGESTSQIEMKSVNTAPAPVDETSSKMNSSQPSGLKQNINTKVLKEIKPIENSTDVSTDQTQPTPANPDAIEVQNTSSTTPTKIKTAKPKKIVKKDRRASIAAVEINQVSTDKLIPQLEMKVQRRPSDSGTLVKQSARIKAKPNDKIKLPPQRQAKTPAVLKTEVLVVIEPIAEPSQLSQSTKEDVNDTLDESKGSGQNTSDPLTSTHNNVAISPFTKASEKIETINNDQNQSNQSINANVLQTEKSRVESNKETSNTNSTTNIAVAEVKTVNLPVQTEVLNSTEVQSTQTPNDSETSGKQSAPVKAKTNEKSKSHSQHQVKISPVTKTDVPIVIATTIAPSHLSQPHKSDVKNYPSEDTKGCAQNTTNSPTPDVILTTFPTMPSMKVETVDTVEAIVAQNQTTKDSKLKSDKETSAVHNLLNKTADLSATNKTEVSSSKDVQLTQTPNLPMVPVPIESVQPEIIQSSDLPNDDVAKQNDLVLQENIAEHTQSEEDTATSAQEATAELPAAPPKKKRKAKRKVVIRRIKRKLSKDDTFIHTQETPADLEICEKEIEEKDLEDEESEEEAEIVPTQPKSCLKARQFEIGDVVMYAERYRKTQVKWRKGIVIERITSISYKLDLEGEEKPAHISYIKKFTNRKVNFGGKEYLEIDYAQIEEDEEKERNYSIWNHV